MTKKKKPKKFCTQCQKPLVDSQLTLGLNKKQLTGLLGSGNFDASGFDKDEIVAAIGNHFRILTSKS